VLNRQNVATIDTAHSDQTDDISQTDDIAQAELAELTNAIEVER
jgi:hypothetical protein